MCTSLVDKPRFERTKDTGDNGRSSKVARVQKHCETTKLACLMLNQADKDTLVTQGKTKREMSAPEKIVFRQCLISMSVLYEDVQNLIAYSFCPCACAHKPSSYSPRPSLSTSLANTLHSAHRHFAQIEQFSLARHYPFVTLDTDISKIVHLHVCLGRVTTPEKSRCAKHKPNVSFACIHMSPLGGAFCEETRMMTSANCSVWPDPSKVAQKSRAKSISDARTAVCKNVESHSCRRNSMCQQANCPCSCSS